MLGSFQGLHSSFGCNTMCTIVPFPGLVSVLMCDVHVHVYTTSNLMCDTENDPHWGWFGVWGRDYPGDRTNKRTKLEQEMLHVWWNAFGISLT